MSPSRIRNATMEESNNWEGMSNEELLIAKAGLESRYWDLMDQIHEAELTRAALLTVIREKNENNNNSL